MPSSSASVFRLMCGVKVLSVLRASADCVSGFSIANTSRRRLKPLVCPAFFCLVLELHENMTHQSECHA